MPKSDQQTKVHLEHVSIDIRPVWWAKLFSRKITLKVFVDHVVLPDGREARGGFTAKKSFTGATQLLWSSNGEGNWNARKRKRADTETALQYVESFKDASRLKCLADHSGDLFNPERFVSKSELDATIALASQNDDPSLLDPDRPLHPTLKGYQYLAIRLLESGEDTRQGHNQRFIDDSLQRHDSFFNEVESNPLTSAQRRSIVGNEDANLVVAGAGSGKTSTIIARIAYLLKEGLAQSGEILTIAFARDARKELEDRATLRIGDHGTSVATFHALGLQIIGESTGKRPNVSVLATDPHALNRFITEAIEDLLSQNDSDAICFCTEFGSEIVNPYDFESLSDYLEAVKNGERKTLKGDLVKSQQEVRISNWFFLNQIEFEYEKKYQEAETGDQKHREYEPDFWIKPGVYLEHFAIAPNEPDVPIFPDYKKDADWKRKLHRSNQTKLYETYSSDFFSSDWKSKLESMCDDLNLARVPMPSDKVLELLRSAGRIRKSSKLLSQFLTLFKESEGDTKKLRSEIESDPTGEVMRHEVFLSLFEKVYARYTEELAATSAIDFSDMIVEAKKHVTTGRFKSPWKHIIIDEFQDISRTRASLISALQRAQTHTRVFAVGDDWQSILRFTGSDVAVMAKDFSDFFGTTQRTDLDRTFRYGTSLLTTSSEFVSKNPDQLEKELTASGPQTSPGIRVVQYALGKDQESESSPKDEQQALQSTLQQIASETPLGKTSSVLILGRYNKTREILAGISFPSSIEHKFLTCHGSKGLEADYAIVCDLVSGRMGFPSEMESDPVLDLILRPEASYEFAEERRLFYVAMTRAKKQCILLSSAADPSAFIEELKSQTTRRDVLFEPEPIAAPASCPKCKARMKSRNGKYGVFWSCKHFPLCEGKLSTCPKCSIGALRVGTDGITACNIETCQYRPDPCPSHTCDGLLMPRSGKYGIFLGCTNYPACKKTKEATGDEFPVPKAQVKRPADRAVENRTQAGGSGFKPQQKTRPKPSMGEGSELLLHSAIESGKGLDVLNALLGEGYDVNAIDRLGKTPLHVAAQADAEPAVIQTLLAAGADPNRVNNSGTPLHYARSYEISRLLIAGETNVSLKNKEGRIALHQFAYRDNAPAIIDALINAGSDVNCVDKKGRTPLDVAESRGWTDNSDLLLSHGAKRGKDLA